uniref:NADH-ubiquinone oxidoreductase chain 2 n=2 Tax=Ichthyomyzon TaxID=7772 RepID=A7YD80_9PETR|nr:NADH dehydrogenase subunit 2 [Ichthyomyzon fossor]YP_009106954.1 NADH dehydrogenase subunit 2 [Ichthyomyzon unicuspis]ABK19888.1 NADH dehydrogenase subunit 2 [Ichthyomyzon unicuspis]ABK19889.1 NADH dehydrogenase subunit 2 [Ichthyomyzon unicuspis]ABK19890.1 NADH dehydrogenase subunit 2 [Ichthyomyzon unicuspis]ABK19891.1 NADH dehydrogenase subunit 2 [Ichthyomyzon fossor]ABK19892.1 NADH dehydrogenase subunit 2 [Ichthyomyzon fossor]
MLSPLIQSTLLMTLGFGTLVTFSSTSWILAWIGLEINTIAIIPLMAKTHHPRSIEATTKYFIAQSAGSATLLITACLTAWYSGNWAISPSNDPIILNIMILTLMLKLGMAPMHFWLPEVMVGLDLTTNMILATWQKLAPITLLIQITQDQNNTLILIPALLSVFIGGWGGLNQTQTRKIMAYSSIAHMGWIASMTPFNPTIAWLTTLIYCLITSATFINLNILKANKITTLTMNKHNQISQMLLLLLLLSLGGLPPLTGFINKFLMSIELASQNLIIYLFMMTMGSLLSLFFYTRMCYLSIILSPPCPTTNLTLWRKAPNKSITLITMLSTNLFILTPQLLAMFTMH